MMMTSPITLGTSTVWSTTRATASTTTRMPIMTSILLRDQVRQRRRRRTWCLVSHTGCEVVATVAVRDAFLVDQAALRTLHGTPARWSVVLHVAVAFRIDARRAAGSEA